MCHLVLIKGLQYSGVAEKWSGGYEKFQQNWPPPDFEYLNIKMPPPPGEKATGTVCFV